VVSSRVRFAVVISALTAGTASAAPALDTSIPVMSLPDALAYARAHQPRIRAALAELEVRRRDARVAGARWLPRIGMTAQILAGTSNNTSASYLNVRDVDLPRIGATPGTADTSWAPQPSTLAALTLDQQVYDFGRSAAERALLDADAGVAQANATAATLDTQLAVEEAYHGVLGAKEVVRATDDAVRRAAAHRDLAQAGVRSGLRPPIELTRAQAAVAQLEVRRFRAETGLVSARAALAASIGSEALAIDAQPLAPGVAESPAFDEVMRLATTRNPMVVAALARLEAQHQARRLLTRQLLPNLWASATLSGRAGGAAPSSGETPFADGWLPAVGNWHVGLILQWTVLDAVVLARRASAAAREAAAGAEIDVVRAGLRLAAQQAFLELSATREAIAGLTAALDAARANHAQAEARFRAGLGTTVELADAEAVLTAAELDLVVGRFAVARARATLGRAIGEPSPASPARITETR
jgi:outer membrane protein